MEGYFNIIHPDEPYHVTNLHWYSFSDVNVIGTKYLNDSCTDLFANFESNLITIFMK
jgi:hypothetical protein